MNVISAVSLTSIFCASREGLKLDLITTFTSSLVRPTSRTNGMTRKGRMMSLVVRYLRQGHCQCAVWHTRMQSHTHALHWPHELILSIRRDEANTALRVKLAETDTLVERAVIDRNGLFPTAAGDTEERNDEETMKHEQRLQRDQTHITHQRWGGMTAYTVWRQKMVNW